MSDCATKYLQCINLSHDRFTEDVEACKGSPECIMAAKAQRDLRDEQCWKDYLACVTGGGTSACSSCDKGT